MVREGKLTADEAFSHPARSILSRVLGTEPGVKLDRREIDLRAGDTLLLCSDGLSSAVPDATIERRLQGASPRDAARRLVVEAKNQGGHDNITVIVLRLAQAEPAERGDEERTAVLSAATLRPGRYRGDRAPAVAGRGRGGERRRAAAPRPRAGGACGCSSPASSSPHSSSASPSLSTSPTTWGSTRATCRCSRVSRTASEGST